MSSVAMSTCLLLVLGLNLEFADAIADRLPIASPDPALEQLVFTVPCERVTDFILDDNVTWSQFLMRQPGYGRKDVLVSPGPDLDGNCSVVSRVEWTSRALWKSIDEDLLADVAAQFVERFGSDPPLVAFPRADGNGLDVLSVTGDAPAPGFPDPGEQVFEINRLTFPCVDLERFIEVDNAVWTQFLARQSGFMQKYQLSDLLGKESKPPGANCSAWTQVRWRSRAEWKAIGSSELHATHAEFVAAFGSDVAVDRWPTPDGLDVIAVADGDAAVFRQKWV